MGFSSLEDEATSEGGEMVEENALQASLFDWLSASVGGEENAVNNSIESMELVDQDDVNIYTSCTYWVAVEIGLNGLDPDLDRNKHRAYW